MRQNRVALEMGGNRALQRTIRKRQEKIISDFLHLFPLPFARRVKKHKYYIDWLFRQKREIALPCLLVGDGLLPFSSSIFLCPLTSTGKERKKESWDRGGQKIETRRMEKLPFRSINFLFIGGPRRDNDIVGAVLSIGRGLVLRKVRPNRGEML